MKRLTYVLLFALLLLIVLALIVWLVNGCNGDGYNLSWKAIGGSAAYVASENYTLGSTIGQPAADLLTSDDYALSGGFWSAAR